MKKVMFAAAVAAAGLAFGIESANTVGYQTYQSGMGIENVGAAFSPINATATWNATSNIYDSAATAGDVVMFLNPEVFDLDYYQFNGKSGDVSQGWTYNTSDPNTGDPVDELVTDPTTVVLPAGQGGYFQPGDGGNRSWTVTL